MGVISIVNGDYKPTCNWGASAFLEGLVSFRPVVTLVHPLSSTLHFRPGNASRKNDAGKKSCWSNVLVFLWFYSNLTGQEVNQHIYIYIYICIYICGLGMIVSCPFLVGYISLHLWECHQLYYLFMVGGPAKRWGFRYHHHPHHSMECRWFLGASCWAGASFDSHRKRSLDFCLVVWLPFFIFPWILGVDDHPNWRFVIFFRGVALAHQPVPYWIIWLIWNNIGIIMEKYWNNYGIIMNHWG